MKICISKSILGTRHHFMWTEGTGYQWVDQIPDDAWVFGDVNHRKSLSEMAIAMGTQISWSPPAVHLRSIQELLGETAELGQIRWDLVLPPRLFKKQLQNLFKDAQNLVKNSNDWNYLATFENSQEAICNLSKINVDQTALAMHLRAAPSGRQNVLQSFKSSGVVHYSRATSTGRLSVASGPEILRLDKKYRDILRSRWGDKGSIIQLDYVSLEPRVLLALTNQDAPDDVYSILDRRVGELTRDDLKRATMTVLYGGGVARLRKLLGTHIDATRVMEGVRGAFKLHTLEDRLKSEYDVTGMLTNFYGRVMHPKQSHPGYLVASHVQSTAVDVALQGFGKIRREVASIEGIEAIGIVHDAIWLDVHHSAAGYLEKLKQAGSQVPGMDLAFPLDEKNVSK